MQIPENVLSQAIVPFQDLSFGASEARTEHNRTPDLFARSYFDKDNLARKVADLECALVLGPKGTGKSALGYHLIDCGSQYGCFVKLANANTLPLSEIPEIKTGKSRGLESAATAWKFILLHNLLKILDESSHAKFSDERRVKAILKAGKEVGLQSENRSARDISRLIRAETLIPASQSRTPLTIFEAIPAMFEIVAKVQSTINSILIIDGLDTIFLNDERYTESLTALVHATYSLNQDLRDMHSPVGITLLLRDDLFSRVSYNLPDIQKFRSDMGESLDWRVTSGPAGRNSSLFSLVNHKAGLTKNTHILDYFPDEIIVASGHKSIPTLKYLLNLTRHTPRDLLALLEEIRRVIERGEIVSTGPVLSQEAIREGVIRYATEYFQDAISNEFAGVPETLKLSKISMSTLRALQKKEFTATEFKNELSETYPEFESKWRDMLDMLFFAGAIGNIVPGAHERYLQFFHRRSAPEVHVGGRLTIADALVHAYGIPFSSSAT